VKNKATATKESTEPRVISLPSMAWLSSHGLAEKPESESELELVPECLPCSSQGWEGSVEHQAMEQVPREGLGARGMIRRRSEAGAGVDSTR